MRGEDKPYDLLAHSSNSVDGSGAGAGGNSDLGDQIDSDDGMAEQPVLIKTTTTDQPVLPESHQQSHYHLSATVIQR